jgi:hypothetical protein
MNTEEIMKRRVQQAVELILDAESLTSGLEDNAAKVLIDWGVAEVERRTRLTAHILDEATANEVVNRAVSRVRRVMKRVAKAADAQGITSRDELTKMLAQTLSEIEAKDAAAAAAPVPAPEPEEAVVPVKDIEAGPELPVEEPAPPEPPEEDFLARVRRFFGGDLP